MINNKIHIRVGLYFKKKYSWKQLKSWEQIHERMNKERERENKGETREGKEWKREQSAGCTSVRLVNTRGKGARKLSWAFTSLYSQNSLNLCGSFNPT